MEYESLFDLVAHHPTPQNELARKLKVKESTVSGWKDRGVPPEWWDRIQKHLGLSDEDLVRALSLREILTGVEKGIRFRKIRAGLRDVLREVILVLLQGDAATAASLSAAVQAQPAPRPTRKGSR